MTTLRKLKLREIHKTSEVLSLLVNLEFYRKLMEIFESLYELEGNEKTFFVKFYSLPKIMKSIEYELEKHFQVEPTLYEYMTSHFYEVTIRDIVQLTGKNLIFMFFPGEAKKLTETVLDLEFLTKNLSQKNVKLEFLFLQELNLSTFLKFRLNYISNQIDKTSEFLEEKKACLKILKTRASICEKNIELFRQKNFRAYEVLKHHQDTLGQCLVNNWQFLT